MPVYSLSIGVRSENGWNASGGDISLDQDRRKRGKGVGSMSELTNLIRDRIQRSPHHRLTFAEFMELALYAPQYGYYSAQANQLGPQGDFVTAVHGGADFAELLAVQLVDIWQRLQYPKPFHWIELGPGQGILADGILTYLRHHAPECLAALHYFLIETSPALAQVQQQRLSPWQTAGVVLQWTTLQEIPPESIVGCCFSNELVDAFPVHLVQVTAAGLQECYVTTSEEPQRFTIAIAPLSTPALSTYFQELGLTLAPPAYPLGYTTEVNLAAIDWVQTIGQKLRQGYVITIDYGYSSDRYYSPGRSQGTLQCYFQHAHHNDPFVNIGRQDMTAHVNFTALEHWGTQAGLQTLGCLPQALFLMALGLGDRLDNLAQIQATDAATLNHALQRRDRLHQLINPLGMGQFTVLVQGKGLATEAQKTLKGLTLPRSVC